MNKTTPHLNTILGPMRLPFLVLPPVCVLLGFSAAVWETSQVNWLYFALALVGAVAAHVSVNAFNEYYDFKSGLDAKTTPTPFSGGSGTLPANPGAARTALITAWVSMLIVVVIGIYFIVVWGWALLPLGLLGVIIVYLYTNWITRSPFICLLAPGLGFGTLMVMGTYFVVTGSYSWTAFAASLVPFFLVSDLLLLNQFPDVEADQSVGRRHYPITLGRAKSARIYVALLGLTYFSVIAAVALGWLPLPALLALLTLVLAVPIAKTVLQNSDDIEALLPAMGKNVLINILTPLLLAIGLFIA